MKKLFFISLVLALLISSSLALAQIKPTTLIVPIPIDGGVTQVTNPGEYIRYIYLFGLSIGGLLGMAIIVYAAIERIVSAGNESKIKDANDRITQAAIGLVLLFGAYIILRAINPNLTNLTLPTLEKPELPSKKIETLADLINKSLEAAKTLEQKRQEENENAVKKLSEVSKTGDQLAILTQAIAVEKAQYWYIAAQSNETDKELKQLELGGVTSQEQARYDQLVKSIETLIKQREQQQIVWTKAEEELAKYKNLQK